MKRFLILFMILGLIAGSVTTAEAKKTTKPIRTERTVEGEYGPYPAPVTGCNEVLGSFACFVVPTRTTERFFTAKVTDLHGQPVFVEVRSGGRTIDHFCGETMSPVEFDRGFQLEFYLVLPLWPEGLHLDCVANRIKTTGTISVTLSNLP